MEGTLGPALVFNRSNIVAIVFQIEKCGWNIEDEVSERKSLQRVFPPFYCIWHIWYSNSDPMRSFFPLQI